MLKKLCIGSFILVLSTLVPLQAAAETRNEIAIVMDGIRLDSGAKPQLRNGITMVPMRRILERLGVTLRWDKVTQSITAKKNEITVLLTMGSKMATKNGKSLTLNEGPINIGGHTYVPLRFISESFGAEVRWNSGSNTVTINTNSYLEDSAKSKGPDTSSADSLKPIMNSLNNVLGESASQYGRILEEFHPDQFITKEQMLKLLVIALYPEAKTIFLAKSFYDLSQDKQFQQLLQYAIQVGILGKDDVINMNEKITNSEAQNIIKKALKLQEIGKGLSLSDFGLDVGPLNNKVLTVEDALVLVEKTKKIHEPLKMYFSHMKEALANSELIDDLSNSISDSAYSEQLKTFVANVKSFAGDPDMYNRVKTSAASLISQLQSFIKIGWKDVISLYKIQNAIHDTNETLQKAVEALKRAKDSVISSDKFYRLKIIPGSCDNGTLEVQTIIERR